MTGSFSTLWLQPGFNLGKPQFLWSGCEKVSVSVTQGFSEACKLTSEQGWIPTFQHLPLSKKDPIATKTTTNYFKYIY